jgi:hypothetical protein
MARASPWAAPLAVALACAAATPAAVAAAPDPLQTWRAAAARGDAQVLAELAVLPFVYDSRPLDRAQFIAQVVPGLFTPAVRRCLARAPAQAEDGALVLWCKPYGFYLREVNGAWRLADFVADVP